MTMLRELCMTVEHEARDRFAFKSRATPKESADHRAGGRWSSREHGFDGPAYFAVGHFRSAAGLAYVYP